ncbi:MAG: insulinase family protein [Candidatus Aminicenantes bacterium]|nr:insulinase family protein [Candidatus Aminicenantes bacterium]
MSKFISSALCLFLLLSIPASLHSANIFPYDYKIEVLENGLKIVSIRLDNPQIISYYTIVRSGSRNEIEPGKSGFAHFFEHMMFKGTKDVPRKEYDNFLTLLGAGTNGYTTDDYTCYFVVFAGQENLESVVKTESDRFLNLYYDEAMIKSEAPVIEGEYYASASDPSRRLIETLRDTAFDFHSYKHTTLGYLEDILDMPNQFEYSKLYQKRFYAPDNSILLVVGDFDQNMLMEYVRKYYSPWEKSNHSLVTPAEKPQTKQKRAHNNWTSPTLPRLAIGFHGPAFSEETIDMAAMDLLAAVAFSSSSAFYQKLVIEEQKCQSFSTSFSDHRDPFLLIFSATVKQENDLPKIEEEIFKELERLKNEPVNAETLAKVKANLKYSFANSLGTTDGIAGSLVHYINLTGDPNTVNKVFDLYETITPEDIQEMTRKYFETTNSTVVTLTEGKGQ